MSLLVVVTAGLAVVVVGIAVAAVFVLKLNTKPADVRRREGESTFLLPGSKTAPVSHLGDEPSCDVSFVIPAYKETERLPPCLQELAAYVAKKLAAEPSFTYEVIVVDDGSGDDTAKCALQLGQQHNFADFKVLQLSQNRGKGGAVKMGMLSSRGKQLLMMDADGATDVNDLDKLIAALAKISKNGLGIAVGSRAHLEEEAVASRTLFRTVLMYGFHLAVYVLCVKGVRDTQCGFKLLTREAARRIIPNLHIERWAFDVEMLYIAQSLGIPIAEIAVNWQEIEGSKLDPLSSSIQMARDLLRIRLQYMLGMWKIESAPLSTSK